MKKTVWLLVILFVMAGGMYTYVFFAGQKNTRANVNSSCCSEVTATENEACPVQSSCASTCSETISNCPSITTNTPPTVSQPPAANSVSEKPANVPNVPCDNCVCGTDEECPNEDKCDQCLEEEQQKQEQNNGQGKGNRDGSGNGSGNGNQGKNRNGRR